MKLWFIAYHIILIISFYHTIFSNLYFQHKLLFFDLVQQYFLVYQITSLGLVFPNCVQPSQEGQPHDSCQRAEARRYKYSIHMLLNMIIGLLSPLIIICRLTTDYGMKGKTCTSGCQMALATCPPLNANIIHIYTVGRLSRSGILISAL